MLSARSEEFDQLTGFEAGADEYVTKPFSPAVFVKRIDALIRQPDIELDIRSETFAEATPVSDVRNRIPGTSLAAIFARPVAISIFSYVPRRSSFCAGNVQDALVRAWSRYPVSNSAPGKRDSNLLSSAFKSWSIGKTE